VRLLGAVAAGRDGEQLSLLPPAGRLLAYLAVRQAPHDREAVAAHLWPASAGAAARANLRTAVWALRKAIGDDVLTASRATVGLCPEEVIVDLADCRRRTAAGGRGHAVPQRAAAGICRRLGRGRAAAAASRAGEGAGSPVRCGRMA
jgi:DNA-binding SARP family transcriptional activator